MKQFTLCLLAAFVCVFVSGCSTFSPPEPEATPATKPGEKMKITRGTGYGYEVPYDSKYSSAQ